MLRNEPIDETLVLQLEPGRSLAECLDLLGAPVLVDADDGTLQFRAIYASERARGWNLAVSTNSDNAPGSLTLGSRDSGVRGVVLWFDETQTLTRIDRGHLEPMLANQVWSRFGRDR